METCHLCTAYAVTTLRLKGRVTPFHLCSQHYAETLATTTGRTAR